MRYGNISSSLVFKYRARLFWLDNRLGLYWLNLQRFVPLHPPENISDNQTSQSQSNAKLSSDIRGNHGFTGELVKHPLNKLVVKGVQQNCRPQAAGFEPQPGKWEAEGDDHHGKHCRCIHIWYARVVQIGQENTGHMPGSPNNSADQRSFGEAGCFG